jgi:CDGSH-type Zn-finger protein
MAIEVVALKNGPFQVSGDVGGLTLNDMDGNAFDLSGKPKVYLCRCGASSMKPFCDGQHSKIGFEADDTAG